MNKRKTHLSLEKRKANITFLSADSVMITTSLWQKTYILKETLVVDLFTLKKIDAKNIGDLSEKKKIESPFYACFLPNTKKEYYALVVIKPGKDKIEILQEEKDIVSMKNNNKTFSVNVYVND